MWPGISNFYKATDLSLIKNESYQQSPEKVKNNGKHKRQHQQFILLSSISAIDLYT